MHIAKLVVFGAAAFAVSCLVVSTSSCDSGGGAMSDAGANPDAPITATSEPLSACAHGWQLEAPTPGYASPCPCNIMHTPECAQSDCESISVFGLMAGGVEVGGSISYSAKAGTMSTFTDVMHGQWHLVDGGIFETSSGGKVAPATCNSAGGVMYIDTPYLPATPGWTAALNAASAQGTTWSAWPVTP